MTSGRGVVGKESSKQRICVVIVQLSCLQHQPEGEDRVLVVHHWSDPEGSPEPWGFLSPLLRMWPGRWIIKCIGSDYCK